MEIIEDRYAKASTIIASQLPVASWYDIIGEDTIADAILDRMIHGLHYAFITLTFLQQTWHSITMSRSQQRVNLQV